MATEQPCDLAYEFGDGQFDLHEYPEGFPRPGNISCFHPSQYGHYLIIIGLSLVESLLTFVLFLNESLNFKEIQSCFLHGRSKEGQNKHIVLAFWGMFWS